MARDIQLPSLLREKRGFKKFTPAEVIRRMEEYLITVRESQLSQEMSKLHEQLEKKNGVALKASSKEKVKDKKTSSSSNPKIIVQDDSDDDSDERLSEEQMPFFVKKFKRIMKKGGFSNKDKDKIKRTSKRPCVWVWQGRTFHCGLSQHKS